jgi:hypothetical protein
MSVGIYDISELKARFPAAFEAGFEAGYAKRTGLGPDYFPSAACEMAYLEGYDEGVEYREAQDRIATDEARSNGRRFG